MNSTPRAVTDLARNAAMVSYGKTLRQLTEAERDHVYEVAWGTYASQRGE